MEEDIPLGSLNSKIYEKNGETYYKITPIFGTQINFFLNSPVSKINVLKNTEDEIVLKTGLLNLKMLFKPYVPGLKKLSLRPYYFGLPFGIYWCEISDQNKQKLSKLFKIHS